MKPTVRYEIFSWPDQDTKAPRHYTVCYNEETLKIQLDQLENLGFSGEVETTNL